MKISEILDPECIRIPLVGDNKLVVIAELVDLLNEHRPLLDRDKVLAAVIAREQTRSTGIGHGLAVPHGKTSGCDALRMAIGIPAAPIDFSSPDGRPCQFIALLVSPPDKTGPHIQALAGISRLWLNEDFRQDIANAKTPQEVYEVVVKHQH